MVVFLPNLSVEALVAVLIGHFEDGPSIPTFIADAYTYFGDLRRDYPEKVKIMLFDKYPTYSFYRFDDTVFVAMYPTTSIKKGVPTF